MQTQRLKRPMRLRFAQLWQRPAVRQWWDRIRAWTERALEKIADGG